MLGEAGHIMMMARGTMGGDLALFDRWLSPQLNHDGKAVNLNETLAVITSTREL